MRGKPLRNPPAMLRGLRPKTKEPWIEVQKKDMSERMEFGSRTSLNQEEFNAYNGLVEDAKMRRRENARAQPWISTPVRHQPPALRGQKIIRQEACAHIIERSHSRLAHPDLAIVFD